MSNLSSKYASELTLINQFIVQIFEESFPHEAQNKLQEAMKYSAAQGGKRIRPLLSLLVARALKKDLNTVLPFAAAVELIHTYSLVHDDLPCMDNDDERRGQPTSHKVFGEDVALLSGDALQSLAFEVLAKHGEEKPQEYLKAISLLAKAIGSQGMVGGQAIDLWALAGGKLDAESLTLLHNLKTGALIHAAVSGAAILCGASQDQLKAFDTYGKNLGLAFQLADDILDDGPDSPELSGFPTIIGMEETNNLLSDSTQDSIIALRAFGEEAKGLIDVAEYNATREI